MCIQVNVCLPRGGEKIIDLCDNKEQLEKMTVRQLKRKMTEELATGDDLRIVFETKMLEEDKLLVSSKIRHMSTVHTLLRLPGGI